MIDILKFMYMHVVYNAQCHDIRSIFYNHIMNYTNHVCGITLYLHISTYEWLLAYMYMYTVKYKKNHAIHIHSHFLDTKASNRVLLLLVDKGLQHTKGLGDGALKQLKKDSNVIIFLNSSHLRIIIVPILNWIKLNAVTFNSPRTTCVHNYLGSTFNCSIVRAVLCSKSLPMITQLNFLYLDMYNTG